MLTAEDAEESWQDPELVSQIDSGHTSSTEMTLKEVDEHSSIDGRRVWRKVDLRILPLVSLLYLLSFLDRTNIGNAQVAGIVQDLHLTSLQFSTATAVFFVTFSVFEVPSNILLKLVRPSRWIPAIMLLWGTVVTLSCLVNNYSELLTARIFLGISEAGLAPGIVYYLSLWYPRRVLALRLALFFSSASLAGAFGGILAFGIEKLDGRAGLHGWQWIFLIEGLLTIVVAAGTYFYMTDTPDIAPFLSDEERRYILSALKGSHTDVGNKVKAEYVVQALKDPKAWVESLMLFSALPSLYAVALFLPTIVNSLGFSAATAQLLSIPPFAFASVYIIIIGYVSDRAGYRGPFAAFNVFLQLLGYSLALASNGSAGMGYAGVVIAAAGAYGNLSVNNAWISGNNAGDVKRGTVVAMSIGMGNVGGIITSFVYDDPPAYHRGHTAIICLLCITLICCVVLMGWFHRLNKQRIAQCKREGITEDMRDAFSEMGDASPLFRFII